ncbi:hypothetical protein BC941DRAFT_448842 [Chlamydoabsidia padenii]|nr:hypothetical protein BC941DRAFT_448842 [Chlamydoabsidia padenii]
MLHSLPQPHSSTVRPTADSRQPTSLEYTSRDSYTQEHLGNGIPSSPVKADSPTVSMSQPTTPRPTGSPHLQPPVTPRDDHYSHQPYLIDTSIRRKRRESDYTTDTPTFGMTHYRGNIYTSDKSTVLDVQIQSKVDRGFFLADNDWTCYRRNYFQTSSSFSLQGVVVLYEGQELPCLVQDPEDKKILHPIEQFYIGISARLSDCSKPISLIQHTAKRDKGPQTTPEPKPIRPGGNLSFSSVGANHSIVTFERIQFKSATANNGKRRAAQQYYVVVMELYAKVRSSGKMIPVASMDSELLVVRGRSPGHYAESHGSSSSSSKLTKVNTINNDTVGGPIRRSYRLTTLTSPPMIPGHPPPHPHPHTPTYASNAPPHPSAMYTADYPPYDYPPHGNGIHYAYAPHAGVPMVPHHQHPHLLHSSSPNGHYDYHTSSPTSHHHHHHHPLPPPQTAYPVSLPPPPALMPPRSDPVYEHPYHQPHYPSLPPPMHRSESAPSTSDHHFNKEEEQRQHWTRVRMASTPDQQEHHNGSPFLPHPSPHHPPPHQQQHHTYYSQQPLSPMSYYHPHLPPPGRQSMAPPEAAHHWQQQQQWREETCSRHDMGNKMESKPEIE